MDTHFGVKSKVGRAGPAAEAALRLVREAEVVGRIGRVLVGVGGHVERVDALVSGPLKGGLVGQGVERDAARLVRLMRLVREWRGVRGKQASKRRRRATRRVDDAHEGELAAGLLKGLEGVAALLALGRRRRGACVPPRRRVRVVPSRLGAVVAPAHVVVRVRHADRVEVAAGEEQVRDVAAVAGLEDAAVVDRIGRRPDGEPPRGRRGRDSWRGRRGRAAGFAGRPRRVELVDLLFEARKGLRLCGDDGLDARCPRRAPRGQRHKVHRLRGFHAAVASAAAARRAS